VRPPAGASSCAGRDQLRGRGDHLDRRTCYWPRGSVPKLAAAPGLTAGPPYFDRLVSELAEIPPQKVRDFLHRDAAHEHVAQLI
jgi:hypothetical protein